jgi:predicted Rossmann-fold nucleotide-binding protein
MNAAPTTAKITPNITKRSTPMKTDPTSTPTARSRWLALTLAAGLGLLAAGCASGPAGSGATAACSSAIPNASYTGPYKGVEDKLSAEDFARDHRCAEQFKAKKYPRGFVTLYGSSRIGEKSRSSDPALREANDALYQGVRTLAARWTKAYAARHPIMTGAGPGLMEAAARGAVEAGGPSIGYTTYYGPARDKADPALAFVELRGADGKATPIITDGLIFTSVAVREAVMFNHSAAMLVAPGGSGTEWEIFQIIEQIKSGQLTPVPVIFIGSRERYWKSFEQRIDALAAIGTLRKAEVMDHITWVEKPEDAFDILRARLKLD